LGHHPIFPLSADMIAEQVRPFQSEDHTPNQGNPEEPPVAVPKAAGCGVHKEEHRHHRNNR
jgi:hypothetical protein